MSNTPHFYNITVPYRVNQAPDARAAAHQKIGRATNTKAQAAPATTNRRIGTEPVHRSNTVVGDIHQALQESRQSI